MATARESALRSDAVLVRAARLGDEEAFEEIVGRFGPGMYRYALRLVGNSHSDAADVTQEAFVSAWRGLATYAGRASLKTWLYRLVHHRAVDLLRTRRPTPVAELPEVGSSPADPLATVLDEELVATLQRCLDDLPWIQRSVWLLREIEQMSYDEMAALLSVSTGSVRGHLHRARHTIAEGMERWR